MEQRYSNFLNIVPEDLKEFINKINTYLIDKKCKRIIKPAAKGYLVSYLLNNKTLLNFVFRKVSLKIRIYANNIDKYQEILNKFPEEKKKLEKLWIAKNLKVKSVVQLVLEVIHLSWIIKNIKNVEIWHFFILSIKKIILLY